MTRFRYKHIQSTVEDRKPSNLLDGEIAVNRFKGKEKLFIKNSNEEVVSFSSDSAIDGKLAEKLNVSDFNAYSGAVDTAINSKASESDLETLSGTVTGHTADTNIHVTTADKTAWNAAATDSHTHSNKSALDAITGNVGTMAYENTSSYSSATQVNTALSNKLEASDIADFFDDAKYEDSGTSKVINFYHGNTIKATINADDFIKDGMIESVALEAKSGTTYLVITWNTAAGKTDTELNIGDIFEADNYYTTAQTNTAIETATSGKVNTSTFTAHTASTVHMSATEKTNLDSLATNIAAISGITSTKVSNWDGAATNSHTHSNKGVLDGISSSDITNWNSKTSNVGTVTSVQIGLPTGLSAATTAITESGKFDVKFSDGYSIPTTLKQGQWDEAYTAKHSHDNKTVLDGITTAKTSSWDTAATSAHNHSNKSTLDAITASSAAINSLTGAVGTMAFQNANSYSSATQVNTALAGKSATATTLAGYGITDAYTKAQTSGASEISTALSYKASQSDLNAISATVTSHTASINDLSGQSETISAAINDLDNKKADSVEVFSSLATKANKSDINDLETDVEDLIKQSETISAALNYLNDEKLDYVDFFDYTSQMKSALESIEDEIEDLSRTVVMSITTTDARGYGESTPTLASYTGNKSNLNGILSHFKLGWFNSGGTLVQECAPGRISAARDGSEIAINGSNGDLMVYVDTDIYRDRATVSGLTVNGSTATTHNVIGLGLAPHQIGGSVAKKFSPFGFTPHCAKYSNSKGYSYYDGGNVQTSINSLTSSVNALNKGGGYMGLYYEFYEIWLIAMYLELGTLDFTQDTLFGYGCTNYTPTASNWFSDVNAGGGGCMYSGNTYGSFWSNTVSSYNFAEMLEAQRIMDGVVKADLVDSMGGTVMMTYDSNGNVVLAPEADPSSWANSTGMTEGKKYFTVKNVPGCQGLGDGVMTGVVNIYVKGTDRIRKYSHPIYRGVDLLSGFFVQLEGLHYVVKHTGTTASLAQSQELFYCESWLDVPTDTSVYTNANSIVTADTAEGLTDDPVLVATYRNAGAFPTGSDGWGRETDYNISLFAHRTIGGAQHTYECGHIWYRGTSWSSPAGTDSNGWLKSNAKSANASVVGCNAVNANAGRTLNALYSVAVSADLYAGGFAHPQIKVK